MNKRIAISAISMVVSCALLLSSAIGAYASEGASNSTASTPPLPAGQGSCPGFEDYGGVIHTKTIMIDNQVNPLLCEFKDGDAALLEIKNKATDYLGQMEQLLSIKEISSSNWKQYYNHRYIVDITSDDLGRQLAELERFFDIYENTAYNQRIRYLAAQAATTDIPEVKKEYQEELMDLLPSTSPLYQNYTRHYTDAIHDMEGITVFQYQ